MAISEFFIRYLQRRDELEPADLARLRAIPTTVQHFAPGEEVIPWGPRRQSCMIRRGLAARIHVLKGQNGQNGAQAITALHVPGDFADLHGFVLTGLEHSVVAFGPVEAEFVGHEHLTAITRDLPHLTRLLWMVTAIDAAIHRQWIVAAASLRSTAHLAHLLCELYTRMSIVGAAHEMRMNLPLLQRQLADMLGYSPIHINRAVRDLRDRRLVSWQGTEVEILDWDGLAQLSRFDPTYLQLERHHR